MNYRKIYTEHYGVIPLDEQGRSFDIHHIDGNRNNNSPENLLALSVEDHYNIHYKQEDWGACFFIATQRLFKTPEEISELARRANRISTEKRLRDGTHNFLGGELSGIVSRARVSSGTHNFLKDNGGSDNARRNNEKMLLSGTHPLQGKSSVTCPNCGKKGNRGAMKRWHFENCRENI